MIIVKEDDWYHAKDEGGSIKGNLKLLYLDSDTSFLQDCYVVGSKRNRGICQKMNEAAIKDIQEEVNEKNYPHYMIAKTRKDNNIINHIMLKLKFKMMVFDENIIWGKVIEPE
jgi:hypothetical protein